MKFKKESGFSLVELLVVITVVAIMGVIITEIFFRNVRGGNKAQILANLKQNGQSVLEVIDKDIRSADAIICPTFASGQTFVTADTLVLTKDGSFTRYKFNNPAPIVNPTTNGYLSADKVENCTDPLTVGNYSVLSDTNPKTGASIINGSFKRDKKAGFRDIVTIKFDVSPGVGGPGALTSQIDAVPFLTTIELR